MTNEEFDRLMVELNKHAERGEVQYNTGKDWADWGKGSIQGKFRIKPQPREAWICFCGEVTVNATFNPPRDADMAAGHGWRKFREVTDE